MPDIPSPGGARPPGRPPVVLLRWPSQDAERRRLAAVGRARVLLIAEEAEPPRPLDGREAWVRDGADAARVLGAMEDVGRRVATAEDRPVLGDDGVLYFAGRWVAFSPAQVGAASLLVRNYRRPVPRHEVAAAYRRAGGSGGSSSVTALIARLNARFAKVALELYTSTRQVLVLAPAPDDARPFPS